MSLIKGARIHKGLNPQKKGVANQEAIFKGGFVHKGQNFPPLIIFQSQRTLAEF